MQAYTKKMGEVTSKFTLSNLADDARLDVDMLVDTGAVLPLINHDVAQQLGLQYMGKMNAELADGSLIELDRVEMRVRWTDPAYQGIPKRSAVCLALVGEVDEFLIGQVVLEQMDLMVDCHRQRLVRSPDAPLVPKFKLK